MKKAVKRTLLVVVCSVGLIVQIALGFLLFVGATILYHSNAVSNLNPVAKADMLRVTLEWGRLAPLPESKNHFQIQTEGSAFTREFRSSFTTTREDVDAWIQASPGLQDAQVSTIGTHTKQYEIQPGDGAQFAEAVIDFEQCLVKIYVCWS